MVIVGIRWMVCDNRIRPEIFNTFFDKLHQFQMRNGIHANIREICSVAPGHTQNSHCFLLILSECFGNIRSCGSMVRHRTNSHRVSLINQLMYRGTRSQHFVIRVCDNNQIVHLFHPLFYNYFHPAYALTYASIHRCDPWFFQCSSLKSFPFLCFYVRTFSECP